MHFAGVFRFRVWGLGLGFRGLGVYGSGLWVLGPEIQDILKLEFVIPTIQECRLCPKSRFTPQAESHSRRGPHPFARLLHDSVIEY